MKNLNPFIFRKYDIRGNVAEDFTKEVVVNLGKAFGTSVLRDGGKIVAISGDVRTTTPDLKANFTTGLRSTGCDVVDIGILPTPVNYYASHKMKIDAAVQITGSHNPPEFNGFKLTLRKKAFYGTEIEALKNLIETQDYEIGNSDFSEYNLVPEYKKMLAEKIQLVRPIRVAMDCGNAVGGLFFEEVLAQLGCEVTPLFCDVDGTFPNHHPDPTVEGNLVDLIETVRQGDYDLGIAFDGDADRVGVVDENGEIIWADYLMAILSKEILGKYPNAPIIFDVKCSKILPEVIKKYGGEPIIWKTGHSLIKDKMRETSAPFAGEMSGHIFYADDFFGFDDALYVALRLMRMLSQTDLKLSEIAAEFPKLHSTPEIRLECPTDAEKFKITQSCIEYFTKNYPCSTVDGVRIDFPEGWGLIRASNTQPVIVCRFEADSGNALAEIKKTVLEKIQSFGTIQI